jgi:Kef-type K+ transport system membrane component KefB
MSLSSADTAHVLVALVVLMSCAHAVGHLFKRLRQPQVIGEIVGGLLLGPTVLGQFSPEAQQWLLPTTGPTAAVLGAFHQIGLLLLVYLTGSELSRRRGGSERRTIGLVAVTGLALPFAFGFGAARLLDLGDLAGPNGSPVTLALIFGMAIAITSVPVISRIMLDLGLLGSPFSRIVLAVAVIEDVVLYVVLAVVLGVAQAGTSDSHGLADLMGVAESLPLSIVYFTVAPLLFLGATMRWGARVFSGLSRCSLNVLSAQSPLAFRLAFIFVLCAACVGLGIDPIFGALVAGMSSARSTDGVTDPSHEALRSVSLGFFVPVYFAIVGVKLDLIRHLDLLFFLGFLVFACVAKLLSVWLGAFLAGENRATSLNLAVAMNARGGPGIVLASTALQAQVIDEGFFTALVLLSIITSQMAGVWLGRAVRTGVLQPLKTAVRQPYKGAEHEDLPGPARPVTVAAQSEPGLGHTPQ